MTNTALLIDADELDEQAGAERAARLLALPTLTRLDESLLAEDALAQAEELVAHLRRHLATIDNAPADEEARIDVGQDVLELTSALSEFAVSTFLLAAVTR